MQLVSIPGAIPYHCSSIDARAPACANSSIWLASFAKISCLRKDARPLTRSGNYEGEAVVRSPADALPQYERSKLQKSCTRTCTVLADQDLPSPRYNNGEFCTSGYFHLWAVIPPIDLLCFFPGVYLFPRHPPVLFSIWTYRCRRRDRSGWVCWYPGAGDAHIWNVYF